MDKANLLSLLKKLTEGELNAHEVNELANAVKKAEHESIVYEFMEKHWQDTGKNNLEPFEDRRARQLYQTITGHRRFKNNHTYVGKLSSGIFLKIAASISIISLAAFIGYRYLAHTTARPLSYIEYHAHAGELIKKKLPDGSSVWLNANSSIKIPSDFTQANRDVFLVGEAFFDVVHNEKSPFIVHTSTVNTTVLGTAFDVEAYDKGSIKITVARGRVQVADQEHPLALLTKSRQLVYSVVTKQAVETEVDASAVSSWITGELRFDNVTLLQATDVLSKRYKVTFDISNAALRNSRFVVSFKQDSKLDEILAIMASLNHFSYLQKNNHIIIKAK